MKLKLPKERWKEHLLVGLVAALLVTCAVWAVWMVVALLLGGVGAALSWIGNLLQSAMRNMSAARGVVFWIGLGGGVLLGALLATNVSLERIRGRFRKQRPVGDSP